MNELPLDNIQELIGQNNKIYYHTQVQYDVKADKFEPRFLVITKYRLILFTCKPLKVDINLSYLDICSIEYKTTKKICIGDDNRKIKLITTNGDFWPVVFRIAETLLHIYQNICLEKHLTSLDLSEEFSTTLKMFISQLSSNLTHGVCGNFAALFRAKCDYYSINYLEDVAWDIENIYYSNDFHEFDFMDFNNLSSRSLLPLISALECNNWFTSVNFSNIKMTTEMAQELAKVFNSNKHIEKLILTNSASKDVIQRLISGFNKSSNISYLDLSNNILDDKGVCLLTSFLSRRPSCLKELHLSKMGLNARSINGLIESLASSPSDHLKHLHCLDISENSLKGEEIGAFNLLLTQCSSLVELNISNTEMALENLFGILLRGPVLSLKILDVTGCHIFSGKKCMGNVPVFWKQFFSSISCLEKCNFSNVKMVPEALRMIFDGLKLNSCLKNLILVLNGCGIGQNCSSILENSLISIYNVISLDISDNGLDLQLAGIIGKLSQNKFIKELFIGRNVSNVKPKFMTQISESIVQLIQEDFLAIEHLNIDNLKLKSDTLSIINALGPNSTLKSINISGNLMGDFGVKMLGKALLINSTLESIQWDNNLTSPNGFHEISMAMNRNYTLTKMNMPLYDISLAVKSNQEKTEKAIKNIEMCLQRNLIGKQRLVFEEYLRVHYCLDVSTHQQSLQKNINEGNMLLQKISNFLKKGASVDETTKLQIDRIKAILSEASKIKDFHNNLGKFLKLETNFSKTIIDKMQSEANDLFKEKLEKYSNEIKTIVKTTYPLVSVELPLEINYDEKELNHTKNTVGDSALTHFDNILIKNVGNMASKLQSDIFINMIILTKKNMTFLMDLSNRLSSELVASGKMKDDDVDSQDSDSKVRRKPKTPVTEDLDKLSELSNPNYQFSTMKKKLRPPSLLENIELQGNDFVKQDVPVARPRRNKCLALISLNNFKIDDANAQSDAKQNSIENCSNVKTSATDIKDVVEFKLKRAAINSMEKKVRSADPNFEGMEFKFERIKISTLQSYSGSVNDVESEIKSTKISSPSSYSKSILNMFKKNSVKENSRESEDISILRSKESGKKNIDLKLSFEAQKLEHIGLNRPKRPKTKAPTNFTSADVSIDSLDEIDNFFMKNNRLTSNGSLSPSESFNDKKMTVASKGTLFPEGLNLLNKTKKKKVPTATLR